VALSGTGPGSTSVVTCDPGLHADNGDQEMTVRCRSNGQWSFPNPGCSGSSKPFVLCLICDNAMLMKNDPSNVNRFLHSYTFRIIR